MLKEKLFGKKFDLLAILFKIQTEQQVETVSSLMEAVSIQLKELADKEHVFNDEDIVWSGQIVSTIIANTRYFFDLYHIEMQKNVTYQLVISLIRIYLIE